MATSQYLDISAILDFPVRKDCLIEIYGDGLDCWVPDCRPREAGGCSSSGFVNRGALQLNSLGTSEYLDTLDIPAILDIPEYRSCVAKNLGR